ncbi:vacuolar transporter chaperone [Apophysomyces ossiformis]|uniref:Vacuolar transporter chaperone n=1 Tax=Apophysomyces ossiformis TaxID=679940 RepID=A0A8H7BQ80_9FUNG|nr:vacuolar transporter chaperone [Apophysomyces ossiformis]
MPSQEKCERLYEPWNFEYVPYDNILQDMTSRQLDHEWTMQDEKDFEITIRMEAEKIDRIIAKRLRDVDMRIAYCERGLMQPRHRRPKMLNKCLTDTLHNLDDLARFIRCNHKALRDLIRMHNTVIITQKRQRLVDLIPSRCLDRQRLDEILVRASSLHALANTERNMSPLSRASFWIHPHHLSEVKAMLLFHLAGSDTGTGNKETDRLVSQVYFDSPLFELYEDYLQYAKSSATLSFCRISDEKIDIEYETNREQAPHRFRFDIKDVTELSAAKNNADISSGESIADNVYEGNEFASKVQDVIREKQLKPILQMICRQSTFRAPDNGQLTIFLDTDIEFTNEPEVTCTVPKTMMHSFPYAVLQIQRTPADLNEQLPSWLIELMDSQLIYEVPCFSKYLYGVAYFWKSELSLLPWWLEDASKDIRTEQSTSCKRRLPPLETGYRFGYLEALLQKSVSERDEQEPATPVPQLQRKGLQTAIPGKAASPDCVRLEITAAEDTPPVPAEGEPSKPKKVKGEKRKLKLSSRVEPKIFFANERNFIHWLHFSSLLLTAALTLLNFGDRVCRISGAFYFGIAFSFALYAFGRFRYRVHQIRTRPYLRYDDLYGPIGLCILLIAALILNFILRAQKPSEKTTYLGIHNTTSDE